ncbi:MAG: VWA domain-containing protein [Acidobacteriota bacterium]
MQSLRIFVAAALAASLATAQEPAPTFKGGVDVVNVLCSVRNKQGGLVANLTKDDFAIAEDGKQQPIRYFARETDLPLTIGLLIDVSRSQERLIQTERDAASQFFTQVLGKKDMAFLISFGMEAELLQDYTGSANLLRRSMDGLKVNAPPPQVMDSPVPSVYQPRGTILYDAVYLAADEKLRGQVGRKVIVLITDGVDQGSRLKIEDALRAAQRADAIVYSIEYYDASAYGYYGGGGGGGTLKKLSEETGGRVFRVDRKHTLQDAFEQIQQEMRSQYAIGYERPPQAQDGSYHRIEVKTRDKDLKVQARKGYYADAPNPA